MKEELLSELPTNNISQGQQPDNTPTLTGGIDVPPPDDDTTTYTMDGGVEMNESIPNLVLLTTSDCHFTHKATLHLLDCGGWVMDVEDRGGRLHALKGAEDFGFEENKQVLLSFTFIEWISKDCMGEWGVMPIEVHCIKEI
ncbi:MAG: hypothetical protein AB8B69_26680 [Chitinophagales bacterium]